MSEKNKKAENRPTATAVDEDLLPLIFPDEANGGSDPSARQDEAVSPADDEEEELDNKTARRKLLESFNDDEGERVNFNVSYVLRGDILTAQWLRRQIGWLIMVVIMTFAYVSNRYYAQKQQIGNNRLANDLKEIHYDAMARQSELMKHCRRSTITLKLGENPDNGLKTPSSQPVIIPSD